MADESLRAQRVTLVNPPVREVIERRYDRPIYPHIGLAYLAAYLRQRQVCCDVVDAKLERLSLQDVLARLRETDPTIVGLTAMTHEVKRAAEAAGRIKGTLSEVTTVIGGVHATALPERTLQEFPQFDLLVCGEGEPTFLNVVTALAQSTSLGEVPGIAYRDSDDVTLTAAAPPIEDLDSLPFPAYDRFPRADEYHVLTARGCPFNCNFCMRPYGRHVRFRSPQNVVAEIEQIVERHRPRYIFICDETFTLNRQRTQELLERMLAAGLEKKVKWYVQTHVNTVDRELFAQMKRAGCFMVSLGAESGDPEILAATGKGIKLPRIEQAFQDAHEAGLLVEGCFILGHPNETEESIRKTIDFAVKLNPSLPIFGIMVPYPGTRVAELAEQGEGGYRILSHDWDAYNKQLGDALEFTRLPRSKLEKAQLLGYVKVFLWNWRVWGFFRFCLRYRREGLGFLKKQIRNLFRRREGK